MLPSEPVIARAPAPSPSKLRLWLTDERRFWRLCTALFCCFAFIKGIRAPGDWPLTQALLDYSHGFIKRGLQGEVLSLLHVSHYHALTVVFFLQLIVLFLLLCLLTRTALPESRFGSYAPIALFASSYAVTFLVHAVGYTDILLAAFTVLLLLVRSSGARFACSLLLVPVALLIHESYLLMFLPVLLLSFFVEAMLQQGAARRKKLVLAGILAGLALALTLATSLRANLSPEEVDRFDNEVTARTDFDIRDDFFNVLSRPLSGSVKESMEGLTYGVWLVPDIVSLIDLLPVTLLLLHFMRRLLHVTVADSKVRRWIWMAALLAILSPLLMFLLGVDGGRWNTVCALNAFVVLLVLCRSLPAGGLTLTQGERNGAVLVLALNVASGWGLFGNTPINPFPFFPALFRQFR